MKTRKRTSEQVRDRAATPAVGTEEIKRELVKLYREEFGKTPDIVTSAPGRINLIGEHTDYNGGYVLPVAIDRRTYTAAGKRGGELFIAYSKELGKKTSFEIQPGKFEHSNFWVNYIKGACSLLSEIMPVKGMNFAIGSTVPRGSGLSSSAAYVVSIIEAVSRLFEIPLKDIDIPLLAQRIENEFVGVQSGIMDPFVAKFAQAQNALLIDSRSLDYKYVRMPEKGSILVCVTGVKRALATTEYNKRRQQCQVAVADISERLERKIEFLRDVSLDEIKSLKDQMDPTLYGRTIHVVTENQRALQTFDALKKEDLGLVGKLMLESHISLRSNYDVSGPELDTYVEIAEQLDGVYGARMTGAGFGGSAICLVDSDYEEELAAEVEARYRDRGYQEGHVFIARTGGGSQVERA